MKTVIVFGGTTEGRMLAEKLADYKINVVYLVATEYGTQPIKSSEYIKIHQGRLDAPEMFELYKTVQPDAIVDATHPFAENVKQEIAASVSDYGCAPCFRLAREEEIIDFSNCTMFDNATDCANALKLTEGKIFLTTGSKELPIFCKEESVRDRVIARVIPSEDSLRICELNGLKGNQIIAMQGPFSKAMNKVLLRETGANILVLKDSGKSSGEAERIQAAAEENVRCFVIKRPEESAKALSMEEVLEHLSQICKTSFNENPINMITPDIKIDVCLAGFGMGFGTLTEEVNSAIQEADLVFGAARMLAAVDCKGKKYPYYLAKDIIPVLKESAATVTTGKKKAVVLFSGDTSFYSGAKKLKLELDKEPSFKSTIMPGISSISALAAKLKEDVQDSVIISTHGVAVDDWEQKLISAAVNNEKTFVLTSGSKDARLIGEILKELQEKEIGKYIVYAGFNLYSNEVLMTLTPDKCSVVNEEGLLVLLIKNKEPRAKRLVPGLSDSDFIRDKTPMSKSEIRALSICKLQICKNSVVYDIGSGSGSVAVELGLIDPTISVYAIEFKNDACQLINKNIEKFCLKNVKLIEGIAPDALKDLPVPTHVFIGGSGGRLEDIIIKLGGYKSQIQVVINAVTIETIAEINDVLKNHGIENPDIVQVGVSKAKRAGDYSIMQAQNPVYIVTFKVN